MKTLDAEATSTEYLSFDAFLKFSKNDLANVAQLDIVPPKLGNSLKSSSQAFGCIRVRYKSPFYGVKGDQIMGQKVRSFRLSE